jgi:hypothetical protein
MYPVEQMMKVLKGYVHNMSHPKGSMAEGYILDDIMGFVIKYLQKFQHVFRRIWDVEEEEGVAREVLEGATKKVVLTPSL